ncbi:DUF72 domain-containing protein [Bordetella sp. 15P40C-2]|uniref:DUF72 domain-containing protein n=1 Tax=Bordetella sp. 15P40C-2 TaxID=2572246 RepID=UPI001325C186|nr:DUF72 domain-containing protein [Bordetella sp. 15P40C-2]MVW70554.1 DUF72 domain-containing protein [Bordetella sp. 15P40C-2]
MHILTGTASWTDPTLLACGRFYPRDVRTPEARLRYYATQFHLLEVDATYYRLLDARVAHAWAQRTPEDFAFHVKAHRLFTGHPAPTQDLPGDIQQELAGQTKLFYHQLPRELQEELWRRFLIALEPLRLAGKLHAIHFQFAPWIQRGARGMALLRECQRYMDEHVMSVEFRHRSWFSTKTASAWTLDVLREANMVHTVVDAPQGFDNTVPALWDATHPDLAVVRLHGRNADAWGNNTGASSGRFQYEYSPEELAELAQSIKRLAERVRNTHVVLNTNYQDQGMRNAAGLAAALRNTPALP